LYCLYKYRVATVTTNERTNLTKIYLFIFEYLWGRSGNKSTITTAIYWLVVPALDDRLC
jgi:hypothetical protein